MNWDRVITIFIVIFLFINILFYGAYQLKKKDEYTLSKERIAQLIKVFNENNLYLEDIITDYSPKEPLLVAPSDVNEEDIKKIASHLLDNDVDIKPIYTPEKIKYVSNNETITLDISGQLGHIHYTSGGGRYVPDTFSETDIVKTAKEFVKKLTINDTSFKLTYFHKQENKYTIEFNEVYRGELIFNSCIHLIMTNKGIINAAYCKAMPLKMEGGKNEMVPFDHALYNFMNHIKDEQSEEEMRIMDVDIGYYVGIEELKNEHSCMAFPYYRIGLSNKEIYFINAYTNKIVRN